MPDAARRRLAAILAADVVGYSRLMETAEAETLARLKAHRNELIDPLLATHGGRLIKLMGDGALVEFPSVVEAVECALAIQRGMVKREADRAEDQRIRFRIGVNLGDVLIDGDDLYGDGVNIAARLEALAQPGGIVLSAGAFDQVVGKLGIVARDLGERTLKNIARPVRVYAIGGESAAAARRPSPRRNWVAVAATVAITATAGTGLYWASQRSPPAVIKAAPRPVGERPAIAVLPFTNLADPADAYIGDGLTEDLAGALARFGELAVIDPAASLALHDRTADIATLGRELGARYLVRGTVRRDGARLRVSAQLVEAPGGGLHWSESYDGAAADVFGVQDDIARQIAAAMAVRVDQLEQGRIATRQPGRPEVYDLTLRGRRLTSEGTRASNREARRILAEAVAKDPGYAPARVALGEALADYALSGWTEFSDDALAEAERAAHAALAIDSNSASATRLLGLVFQARLQFDLALAEFDRALTANPSDARSYEWRGDTLMWSGDSAACIASVEEARRLNPGIGYGTLGRCLYFVGHYREAVAMLSRGLPAEPWPQNRATNLAILAAAYAQLGDAEAVARTRIDLAKAAPFFDSDLLVSLLRSESDRAHLRDGLAKAGIGS